MYFKLVKSMWLLTALLVQNASNGTGGRGEHKSSVTVILATFIKSVSMRGPGSGDTCHLTDFNETWPD